MSSSSSSSSASTPYTAMPSEMVMARRTGSSRSGRDNAHRNAPVYIETPQPPHDYKFDRGVVRMLAADESLLRDQSLNEPHGCDRMFLKVPSACLATVLPIPGWCWLCSKTNLVRQNELAVVTHMDGAVSLLNPGLHLSGCMTTVRKFPVAQDRINHGNMHIIRILPGTYGKARRNGRPEFLSPGRHVIKDPLFEFSGTEEISSPRIVNGTSNIITVRGDQVALCMMYGDGIILEEGVHFIDSAAFTFVGFVKRTKEHINVGRLHRVLVPAGKIGLGWDKGAPIVVEHGEVFETVSGFFSYKGSVDLTRDVITHGSLKFIQVKEGTYGISNDEGVLHVLQPGRHVLSKPTHTFQGFLPSGQITLAIEAVTSMSADNVGIRFDSALTIQVSNARLACSQLGMYSPEVLSGESSRAGNSQENKFSLQAFYANVIAKAKLSLSILIGNNRINQSFRVTSKPARKVVVAEVVGESAPGDEDPEAEQEPAGSFKQHIHDIFMHSFSEDMKERCGVDVIDMSIEDIVITNQELARAMARGAVAATDLDKSRIEYEVSQTKAKSERAAMITKAEGEAEAMSIIAQAEADRIQKLDEAMKGISEMTRQRELINSAGNVVGKSRSTILLGSNVNDVARILGGGPGMGVMGASMQE